MYLIFNVERIRTLNTLAIQSADKMFQESNSSKLAIVIKLVLFQLISGVFVFTITFGFVSSFVNSSMMQNENTELLPPKKLPLFPNKISLET